MKYRICNNCNKKKGVSFFRDNRKKCKQCNKVELGIWRNNNKDKVAIHSKRSRDKRTPEQIEKEKIFKAKWFQNNKDRMRIKNKDWRNNNKEESRNHQKKYYNKNKEAIYIINRKHRFENIEAYRERERKYIRELKDSYIKKLLYTKGFEYKDMSDDLIDSQRLIIKINRTLKTKNHGKCNKVKERAE